MVMVVGVSECINKEVHYKCPHYHQYYHVLSPKSLSFVYLIIIPVCGVLLLKMFFKFHIMLMVN